MRSIRPSLFDILGVSSAQDLRAADKLVLVYLAWRQGSNGRSWPSLKTIEDDLGICRRTCLRAIARLCENGCIEKTPGRPGRGRSNRYTVGTRKGTHDATFSPEEKGRIPPPFDAQKGRILSPKKDAPRVLKEQGKEPTKSIVHRSPAKTHRQKPTGQPFTPPTVEEVLAYASERGRPDFDAEHFVEHYTLAEWRDKGGKPITVWKQTLLGWLHRDERGQGARLDADGQPRIPDATYTRRGKLVSRPPTAEQEQELIARGFMSP